MRESDNLMAVGYFTVYSAGTATKSTFAYALNPHYTLQAEYLDDAFIHWEVASSAAGADYREYLDSTACALPEELQYQQLEWYARLTV